MRNIGFRAISINVPDMEGQWVTTDEVGFFNFFHALKEGDLDEKTLGEKTGLKDKNGKEIYEGDIVTLQYSDQVLPEDNVFEVYWSEDISGFDLRNKEETESLLYGNSKYEVIGNVWENPELLKQ